PKKGIHILNKLFELYNIAGVQDKNRIADTTLRFIDDRLNTVLAQLDSVERNIQNYKSRNSIADLGSQAGAYFGNIIQLEQRNAQLGLQLEGLNDMQSYINSKRTEPGTVPSLSLVQDQTLSSLLT